MLKVREVILRPLLVAVLFMTLMGCKATDKFFSDKSEQPQSNQPQVVVKAQPGLSPRERFSKALEHLEQGESAQARAELDAYLLNIPNSASAKELLRQIDSPAQRYFPPEYFEVILSSGESLSTLAGKYLNSPLKFYALAKYNQISSPSKVNIGQTIKIPLTPEAKFARSQLSKTAPKPEILATETEVVLKTPDVQEDFIEDKVDEPIVMPETRPEHVEQVAPPSAASLMQTMLSYTQQQDYASAVEQYHSLKSLGSLTDEARDIALIALEGYGKQLVKSDKLLASNNYAEAASLNLQSGNKMQAFRDFKQASELHPENSQAMEEMLILQKEIADQYHREASSAFRRQELDKAISKWEQVLEVDPNHNSAKLYLAQALELKERLEKIKN
ncbi:LysM peptidoglycan-binding domain-containing protein [Bowmanella yangjiangensis]|uniref:LysM peptidoglycan-binding domain-containing protein n=1 Tax=Bowmanella yangjiangensis TaxID=2811230 RepID=UPI001E4E12AB|nr:LysM domain-containing protein [Bowmanella yangjiangensis]